MDVALYSTTLNPHRYRILRALLTDMPVKQIAFALGYTPGTVKVYSRDLYRALGIASRVSLQARALRSLAIGNGEADIWRKLILEVETKNKVAA